MTGGSFPAQYQLQLCGGQGRLQRHSRGGGRKEEKEEEEKEGAPVGDDEAKCYRGLERSNNKRRELLEDSPRLTGFILLGWFAAG